MAAGPNEPTVLVVPTEGDRARLLQGTEPFRWVLPPRAYRSTAKRHPGRWKPVLGAGTVLGDQQQALVLVWYGQAQPAGLLHLLYRLGRLYDPRLLPLVPLHRVTVTQAVLLAEERLEHRLQLAGYSAGTVLVLP